MTVGLGNFQKFVLQYLCSATDDWISISIFSSFAADMAGNLSDPPSQPMAADARENASASGYNDEVSLRQFLFSDLP